jgi:hypothetical protein
MDFTGPHHVPVVSARATRSRVASGEAELAKESLGLDAHLDAHFDVHLDVHLDARPAREVARARASREGNIASRAGREVHEQRRWLASHRATVERTLHSVSAHSAWLLQHREGAACHRAGARRRRSSTRARLEGVWIAAETAVNHALRIWSAAFPRDQPWSNQVR